MAGGYHPETIETDPHRLKQILLNLIGNAIKFTSAGAVEVVVTMKPAPWTCDQHQNKERAEPPEDQWLCFLVKDTGVGIAPEHQEKLFKPFVQADTSITRKYGGTGLGLFLSKQLAINLGGNLVLRESVPGHGSTFEFVIRHCPTSNSSLICDFSLNQTPGQLVQLDPSADKGGAVQSLEDGQTEQSSHAPTAQVALKPLSGIKVLVVEDSPDLRLLLGQILKSQGAVCSFATSGSEGVEAIFQDPTGFDLVLMDIQMPVMDGYAAAAKLREYEYQKPVIALTAYALVGERERCLAAGFRDYLTKPVEVRRLIQTVSRWVKKTSAKTQPVMEQPSLPGNLQHFGDASGKPGAKNESQIRS